MKIDNSPARGMRDLCPLTPPSVTMCRVDLRGVPAVRLPADRDACAVEYLRLAKRRGRAEREADFEVLKRGLPPEVGAGMPLRDLVDLGRRTTWRAADAVDGKNHAPLPMPFRSLQVGRGVAGGPAAAGPRPAVRHARSTSSASRRCWPRRNCSERPARRSEHRGPAPRSGCRTGGSWRRWRWTAGCPKAMTPSSSRGQPRQDRLVGAQAELAELGFPPARGRRWRRRSRGWPTCRREAGARAGGQRAGPAADVIGDLATTAASLDRLATERTPSWEFDLMLVRGMGSTPGRSSRSCTGT